MWTSKEHLKHEDIVDQRLYTIMKVLGPLREGWQVARLCCAHKVLKLSQQPALQIELSQAQ